MKASAATTAGLSAQRSIQLALAEHYPCKSREGKGAKKDLKSTEKQILKLINGKIKTDSNSMNIHSTPAFKDCYLMQPEDLQRFADTLADGFKGYSMFEHVCYGAYDHDLMRLP